MNIYISSSWKNRDDVRNLAVQLRAAGHEVYDFTDPACRSTPEIPPERFPEQFDPAVHVYREYLQSVPEWYDAVRANRDALRWCDAAVLLLPAGNDAHADAYYALGLGKQLIVCGHPGKGERSPTHLWAHCLVNSHAEVVRALPLVGAEIARQKHLAGL